VYDNNLYLCIRKKEIQAISFSKSGKGLYSYKDNKLGLKKIGYKKEKKL